MAPLFETIKVRLFAIRAANFGLTRLLQSFSDVQITSDGVDTANFLEASDGLVTMFGTFFSLKLRAIH